MKKYDAIICGAGPAGAVAAIQLTKNKYSVLLLDKDAFPRDKICGDQLPPSGTDLLREMEIIDTEFFNDYNNIGAAVITGPFGTEINFKFEFLSEYSKPYIIPREILDNEIFKKVSDLGIDFRNEKLIGYSIDDKQVLVKTQNGATENEYYGKVLIAADGSNSIINRIADYSPYKMRGIAIRSYVQGVSCEPEKVEGYLLDQFKKGYTWIFPFTDSSANVGLGMDLAEYLNQPKNLKQFLIEFLENDKISRRLSPDYKVNSIKAWPLNIGPPDWNNMVQNRLVRIGDAAGLVMPFTGGGIVNALLSGKLAGEILSTKLTMDKLNYDSLMDYTKRIKKEIGFEMTVTYYLQKYLSHSPKNIEFLMRIARKSTIPYRLMNKVFTDVKMSILN